MERQPQGGIYRSTLLSILAVSLVPLALLSWLALRNISSAGAGAVADARAALDGKAAEALEVRAIETARTVATFLEGREADVRTLALLPRTPQDYQAFYRAHHGTLWSLRDGVQQRRAIPLYREIAYMDPAGQERLRLDDGRVTPPAQLRDVSKPANTTLKCETYFLEARKLPPGGVYVGHVMGVYVTKQEAEAGRQFSGLLRFAMPVHDTGGRLQGVVALALDSRHLEEFTAHLVPTARGFAAAPDPNTANYAYIVDDQARTIAHPTDWLQWGIAPDGSSLPYARRKEDIGRLPPRLDLMGFADENLARLPGLASTGKPGSVQYQWAGHEKFAAYAPIPYYGGGYTTALGFGWVAIGADVATFHEAAAKVGEQIALNTRSLLATTLGIFVLASLVVLLIAGRTAAQLVRETNQARQAEEALRVSERKFREIVARSLVGIFRTSVSGEILECNPALLRTLGAESVEQLNEIGLRHLYADPAERDRLLSEVQEGPVSDFETLFHRANGEVFPVRLSAHLVYDEQGAPEFLEGTLEDISERRRAEAERRATERLLRDVFDFLPDPTLVIDRAGRVTAWNRAMEELTGVAAADILGKGDYEYALPFYGERRPILIDLVFLPLDEFETKYAHIQRVGDRLAGEAYMPGMGGQQIFLAGTAGPLCDPEGNIIGAIEVIRDITERKQAEEELERAKDEAESANRSKSTFLANMSHELRTPLNAIIGYSEMLIEEAEDLGCADAVPDLQKIRAAGQHLLALINDILDLSKIEAGKMELYLEDFDVAQTVGEVASTVAPLVEKNANRLELDLAPGLGTMHADLMKVRQSLLNLLSNAAKFSHQGQITMAVRRESVGGQDWIVFRVSDTGIGMTPEQKARVFQPFTQADASSTRRYGGTGLGLTITKRFCEIMAGEITLESEIGRGTTFAIRLPADVGAAQEAGQATEEEGRAVPIAPTGAGTVLVVDDDPSTRETLQRWLSEAGFHVITAGSGREALERARQVSPQVITLDVVMSGMDGWTVLRELKNTPELADIPVVMVTMLRDRRQAYALGVADYLAKPVNRERLTALVRRYAPAPQNRPILVVDDDPQVRELLRHALEKEGWAVTEADNGQVALQRMEEKAPALILLDLMMPVMDGLEFLPIMRGREEWRSIPVVIVTAKELTEAERRQLSEHAREVLSKGAYTREGLAREIARLVGEAPPAPAGPEKSQ